MLLALEALVAAALEVVTSTLVVLEEAQVLLALEALAVVAP